MFPNSMATDGINVMQGFVFKELSAITYTQERVEKG
jgi:hypothetical protein